MVLVTTRIPFYPDRHEDAMDAVTSLVDASRAEPGTVDYWAATDVDDPNVVRFVERYEDAAAAEAHQRTEHYRRFVELLPELVDGTIETTQFDDAGEARTASFDAEAVVAALDDDGGADGKS